MSQDQTPGRGPEKPRYEPEIIPPGEEPRAPRDSAQPGWVGTIAFFLILGLIAAFVFIVIAVAVFVLIPLSSKDLNQRGQGTYMRHAAILGATVTGVFLVAFQ